MKRILIALLFLCTSVKAQEVLKLSEAARISVITCGPGQDELYSAFGHSAFRVYDSIQQVDWAYNYGVFDFNQPHFYLNFAKGFLYYKLGVHDYKTFEFHYLSEGRYVHEQILDLTPAQTQKLFDFLQWNALPENENYRYDYFYNNCATKIRDVVAEVFAGDVQFHSPRIDTHYSIRALTDIYIKKQQPWGDLGIDICLGLPMDKEASPYEYMFLPDYIEAGFDHATIKRDSVAIPLIKKTIRMGNHVADDKASTIQPIHCFGAFALLGIVLSLIDWRRKKISMWFDVSWLIATGLIGLLLTFLWLFTDHAAAAKNYNLLWAIPFNLVAAIALFPNPRWLKHYFLGLMIIEVLTLITYGLLPQDLHDALIPLILTFAIRSFVQYRIRTTA